MLYEILYHLCDIFNSTYLLLATKCLAFLYQAVAIIKISTYLKKRKNIKYSLIAIAFVATTMAINLNWIIELGKNLEVITPTKPYRVAFSRICWALVALNKLILNYAIITFTNKRLNSVSIVESVLGVSLTTLFGFVSVYYFQNFSIYDRPTIEFIAQKWTYFYACYIYTRVALSTWYSIYSNNKLPKIKKQQLRFLLLYIFIPQFISDLLTANPLAFSSAYTFQNYGFKSLTTILLTYAMHYCARNLFKLRFFNIYSQVGSDGNNQVTTDFKPVLERVSKVTSADELKRIVTQFIAHTYELPENTIYFYIRNREHTNGEDSHTSDPMYDRVEQLLQSSIFYDEAVMRMLHDHKVLIQDELAFSQEYDPSHAQATLLYLCQELRASAFIPIFQYDRLVGYIMIEEYAREELFTQREQDELSMLAHYLSNIIYLLSHRDIGSVIAREKDLRAQLYRREREVEQYKESIRSCLRLSRDTDIGVMVYKHRRFHFRNKVAHEIAGVDPNTDKGHPLTHTLNDMVSKVETQQQRKVTSCQNGYHHTIMISAMHELENNGIIITLSYPDATQTLQTYLNEANDPQDWDYLVYLETTQMGRHLDRLIPGKHKQIINLKLSILHAALSKSPVLISATREDAIELVSFLHSASDRDIYHTITLDRPERSNHVSHELVGTARKSPLADPTLLEQLHEQGTLCIENAHFLSFHTQKQLAHYLHYGYFQQENSEYKLISDMRVICTTPYTTNRLLEQGMLLPSFHKHVPYTISMPNFETLSEDAFQALVDALVSQMSPHYSTQRFIACSHRDYAYLRRTCSESLHALRHGIAHLMHKKSEKHNLNTKVDAVSLPQEPTLFRAAQLGKEALKDRDLMIFLWNTFKSQQKIATLLNVNRSSVNRRIKQFNIEHESEQVS